LVETVLKKYFFIRCANFFVGIGFPTMQTALENYTFLPFSVFLALFWVFTYKKVI
jgi:SP family facilitated glucose transporter-like MFS transporter 1